MARYTFVVVVCDSCGSGLPDGTRADAACGACRKEKSNAKSRRYAQTDKRKAYKREHERGRRARIREVLNAAL